MRIQLWKNGAKQKEEEPDYIAMQRQRTGADDGSPRYETAEVGYGFKMTAPSGETYLDVTIKGFTDNKPKV